METNQKFNILNFGYQIKKSHRQNVIQNIYNEEISRGNGKRLDQSHPAMSEYWKHHYSMISKKIQDDQYSFQNENSVKKLVATISNVLFTVLAIGFCGYYISNHLTDRLEFRFLFGFVSALIVLIAELFLIWRAIERLDQQQYQYYQMDYTSQDQGKHQSNYDRKNK